MPLINKEAMDSDSVSACPNNGNKQMRIKYFFIYLNKNTLITSWLGLTECIKRLYSQIQLSLSFLKNSVHILIVTSERISTYLLQLVRAPHAPNLFIRDIVTSPFYRYWLAALYTLAGSVEILVTLLGVHTFHH